MMQDTCHPHTASPVLRIYHIRLKGHLDRRWTGWFGELVISLERDGNTLLTGPIVDQAELYGLLKRVRDTGMQLLSVNCLESNQCDAAERPASDAAPSEEHETL